MIKARYTVVLKTLLDDADTQAKIKNALSSYPLYESYIQHEHIKIPKLIPTREELNEMILNHYKYREIGFETIAQFIDRLEITMNEIMPYYNQLYFSLDQDYNILYNVDYVREHTMNRDTKDNSTATMTNDNEALTKSTHSAESSTTASDSSTTDTTMTDNSKSVKSKTPQNVLGITADDIESVQYADEVDFSKNNSSSQTGTTGSTQSATETSGNSQTTNESSSTGNTVSDSTGEVAETNRETIRGNYGQVSTQSLIDQYRELILNVTKKLINDKEINELFMTIY